MKPIAVIVTDPHLKRDNQLLINNLFDQVIEFMTDNSINQLFIAGDLFTARESQPLHLFETWHQIFDKLNQQEIDYNIIAGNHDKVNLNSPYSYISPFFRGGESKHFTSVYDYKAVGQFNFHLAPYFKESESYPKLLELALARIKKDKLQNNILITHIAVNGVRNNDGSEQSGVIPSEALKVFDKVLIGHFHDQQKISDNIYYIGSMYQGNFGEDDLKGMTVFYDDGSISLVPLTFPKYIKIKVDIEDKKALKQIKTEMAGSEDHVRVILVGDESKMNTTSKEELAQLGIEVQLEKREVEITVDSMSKNTLTFDSSNISEAFDIFCDKSQIQEEEKETGLKYLTKILK